MTKKRTKTKKVNAEFAKELDASDLTWELFQKTNDVNYYRLYSAIKNNDNKK